MTFINNDFELKSLAQSRFDVFQKILAFTFFQSIIARLGQFFPIDETTIVLCKSARHHIGKEFGLRIVDILVHLSFTLFFQISFSRSKPNEDRVGRAFAVFVHKVGKDDGFPAAGRTFQHDVTFVVFHCLFQFCNCFQLKIGQTNVTTTIGTCV